MVQWLCLSAFSVGDCIPSLVGELGSQKSHSVAKLKKKTTTKTNQLCVCLTYFLKALLQMEVLRG